MKKVLSIPCLCLFLLAACFQQKKEFHHLPPKRVPLFILEKQDCRVTYTFPVVLRGSHSVEVRPLVRGRIIRMGWLEGEPVKEGQLLFELDPEPCQAALKEAESLARAARAHLEDARLEYQSRETLRRSNHVSEVDLQHCRYRLEKAQAEWEAAEAKREEAQTHLRNTQIYSPLQGVAGMSPFRCGSLVDPQMEQPLVIVSDTGKMDAFLSLSEQERRLLQKAGRNDSLLETLRKNWEVSLLTDGGKVLSMDGCVESVSGVVDEGTGAISVKFSFLNPDGLLLHGSTSRLKLTSVRKDALVIPRVATFSLQERTFVWVVRGGMAVSREIRTEECENHRSCVVTSGLEPGECIIASGAGLVREGETILSLEQS